MLIFFFVLTVVLVLIAFIGKTSADLNDKFEDLEVDDYANSILLEFELVQSVEGGYERTFIVPSHLLNRFNVTFDSNYLILQDTHRGKSDKSFYPITGNFTYTNRTTIDFYGQEQLEITIVKDFKSDYKGIVIYNN